MMTIYLGVFFGIIAAQLAPGPNLLAVASVALAQGRQPAICVAAGVATGVLIWVSACAFGIVTLFNSFPLTGVFLQIIGGAYFLWLAWRALGAVRDGTASSIRASRQLGSLSNAYKRGLFVVLTNPKAAIMWIAISAFLLGSGFTSQQVLLLAPMGAASALIIYGGYGILFSTSIANRIYTQSARGLDALLAVLFAGFGIKFLYDGVRELEASL
jgi:threonine efflux protein